ncbi:MAG: molybdopterin molybdotransferase MoeA [Prochloraceae cyanobacterium]|nr:molybdopterin molybdotransferase MoeA [Prochloraceae cyanobacterium]
MKSVKEAEKIILDSVQPIQEIETVNLENSCNRVLATTVSSKLDFPYWDNSAMDGYAIKYADLANYSDLEIIEEIPAGYQPQKTILSGQAARIFTGGMIPEGADTIVIQENTQKEGNKLKILSSPQPQQYVRKRGSFYQAGNPMLEAGITITPADLAVLATAQCDRLSVYRRPKVAIFSTGDELITPDATLQPGQIIDSNQSALAAIVAQNGGIPLPMGIVPDNKELLRKTIAKAIREADLVLSTGGVSVGEYDYVEEILAELGGKIQIRSVAVKPGKPLTVAKFSNNCLYFGIPGNPVSALVSCWRFVQPALKKLSGVAKGWQPEFISAIAAGEMKGNSKRESYLWGKINLVDGIYHFEVAGGSKSSGNLINLAQTNALAMIPLGVNNIAVGDRIMVMFVN